MAPVKKEAEKPEKEAKLSPEAAADLMLNYLRKQNRPYSATDISANLKNRVTKATAAKILKDMHERKDIEGRAAGKQIVYHAVQDPADSETAESLQATEAETVGLRDATTALKAEEKILRQSLRENATQVPLTEIRTSIATLEQEKLEMHARLAKLKSGNLKPVTADERDKVNTAYRKWEKAERSRKKIRAEMWKEIAGMQESEAKAADVMEELGIEM